MNDIARVLRAAAWRLGLNGFFFALCAALSAALLGAIVLRVVQRAVVFDVDWIAVATWSAVGCLVSAVVCAVVFRPRGKQVALQVDQGANLREALSTALCIADQQDPWSRATVESAARSARGVRLASAVPIQGPRFWPVPLALALAFAVVYLALPNLDLFSRSTKIARDQERDLAVLQVTQQTIEIKQKLEQMTQQLGLEPDAEPPTPTGRPEDRDPEAIRRSAIKELTRLSDRLQQVRQSENAQKLDAAKNALSQLKPPGEQTSDLSKSLADGNFQQAKQDLEQLLNKLQEGNLSESDKQAIGEQLRNLAEQIQKAAANQESLEKKLAEMGIDPKAASDPQALKEAIKNAEGLSAEQKQQLESMMNAAQKASESLSSVAEAMNQMAQQCQNPGQANEGQQSNSGQQQPGEQGQQGQQGEGMQAAAEAMAGQLSELEQIAMEMQLADAALSECQAGMQALGESAGQCSGMGEGMSYSQGDGDGTGQYAEGDIVSSGSGTGGPGRGRGGQMTESAAGFETSKKIDNKNQSNKGPVIASRLVEGEAILNETSAEFASVVAIAESEAAEEISSNVIPRDRHEAVKRYFGKVKSDAQKKAAPAAAEPAKPTEAAKDAK